MTAGGDRGSGSLGAGGASAPTATDPADEFLDASTAISPIKPWRWVSAAVIVVLVGLYLRVLFTSEAMQWDVVWDYVFEGSILSGLLRTLELTALAMVVGLILGILIAIMRLSTNPVLKWFSWAWVWFFRGVPPLVQLIFWYNMASLIPEFNLGIPFTDISAGSWDMNSLMTPFAAAILGLALPESAYAAETIRAGIQAVNRGQSEAAASLGMTPGQNMRRIVLPQALKIVIPPIGNDTISMLKFTSLVSVLALPDLLFSAQQIYSRTYQTIPLLVVATLWYLLLTTLLTWVETFVEHQLSKGHTVVARGKSPWKLLPSKHSDPDADPSPTRAGAPGSAATQKTLS